MHKDQYLNYLALELLEILGNDNPRQDQIDRTETSILNCCKYLDCMATELLKLAGNDIPAHKKTRKIELLIVDFCQKYLCKKDKYIIVKKIKSRFLRKHRVIKDNV